MSRTTILTLLVTLLVASAACHVKFLEAKSGKTELAGFNPAEIYEVYNRFVKGTQVLDNVPNKEACDVQSYPEIIGDFAFIVNSIRQFDINDDVYEQALEIIKTIEDLLPRLKELNENCNVYQASVHAKLEELKAHFHKKQYLENLLSHTMFNLAGLTQQFKDLTALVADKNFADGAEAFGALLRFSAFWDFE